MRMMLHQMKLKLSPFEKIKNGCKTIELRLYDEKRQKVRIGDFIEFTCLDKPKQRIQTRVTALHKFTSFAELYAALPKEKLGYNPTDTPAPNHMDEYYSREDQKKYGVLGIELYCTDLQKFIDAQDSDYYEIKPEHNEPYFAGTVEGEKDTMMFLKLYICSEMQAFFCGHDNDTDENMDYLNTAFTEDLMEQWGQWPDCLEE